MKFQKSLCLREGSGQRQKINNSLPNGVVYSLDFAFHRHRYHRILLCIMPKRNNQPQLPFAKQQIEEKLFFGGDFLKNSHAKKERPLSGKDPMHIVLRSTKAMGKRSMLYYKNENKIAEIICNNADKLGIKVIDMVNVGNHLHLIVKLNTPNKTVTQLAYCRFIRSISGLIARAVLGAQRGKAFRIKFWDQRPFTRIVKSWTALKHLKNYILKNRLQSWGMPLDYAPVMVGYCEIKTTKKASGFD